MGKEAAQYRGAKFFSVNEAGRTAAREIFVQIGIGALALGKGNNLRGEIRVEFGLADRAVNAYIVARWLSVKPINCRGTVLVP